jgi:hypothetical protein
MDRNVLLKMAGFSQKFISALEDYDNSVIEIPFDDFSNERDLYNVSDSTNILLENIVINSNTKIIVSRV